MPWCRHFRLDRRHLIQGAAALGAMSATGLAGCVVRRGGAAQADFAPYDRIPLLAPIHAQADRLFDITVCLRPFRAAGPRLDAEAIGHLWTRSPS